jgi:hypothetical protein
MALACIAGLGLGRLSSDASRSSSTAHAPATAMVTPVDWRAQRDLRHVPAVEIPIDL